uniref:Uncharacterized protein n=1 Tax=Octopus bimaculoides TaxID=37653 RepID=A0A0L8HLR7_OCTBM
MGDFWKENTRRMTKSKEFERKRKVESMNKEVCIKRKSSKKLIKCKICARNFYRSLQTLIKLDEKR